MRTLRTVTLNTGYDDHFTVGDPVWGGVAPMHSFRSVCSGKGISCARAATALGVPNVAYALVGGEDKPDYSRRLTEEGIVHRLISVPGATRHNLTLVDAAGEKVAAHFVAQGFTLDGSDDVAPLVDTLLGDVRPGDLVTLNGSVPTGLPASTWADLARAVIERGAEVIVDAQQQALVEALEVEGVLAFKPNDEEILAIPGVAAADPDDRVAVALEALRAAGVRLPMVSLGARGVAYLPGPSIHLADQEAEATAPHPRGTRDSTPHTRGTRGQEIASLPVERPVQSVMAGDSFVAGLAWGRFASDEPTQWLRHALAAAAAHVAGLTGTDLGARARENLARARLA
ncbi:MAG TPA: hypothetical protein GX013_09085 [Propionibacterium sp.]|nr:hypothetical protein [Propionibacterium sp.]